MYYNVCTLCMYMVYEYMHMYTVQVVWMHVTMQGISIFIHHGHSSAKPTSGAQHCIVYKCSHPKR